MLTGNIFISYRHYDTAGYARGIYDRLKARYPNRVFMDVATISLGEDFVSSIERHIASCRVFIALIGREWATMTDEQGRRRLDLREDFVRIEVSSAFRQSITIIPVLVRGAKMPAAETLPGDISAITRHNALQITEGDFEHDVDRLIARLDEIFEVPPTPLPHPANWKRRFARTALMVGTGIFGLLMVIGIGLFIRTHFRKPDPKPVVIGPGPTPEATTPPGMVRFVNSIDNLDGDLAQHYVDFSFNYPRTWRRYGDAGVPGARNFVRVERSLPGERTQENFAVGWYASELDVHRVAEDLSAQFSRTFREYRKVSEGLTRIGTYTGYEFRFESVSRNTASGDIHIWGRTILIPALESQHQNGVTLLMLTTSLAPELQTVDDVGIKGELPIILQSFKITPKKEVRD